MWNDCNPDLPSCGFKSRLAHQLNPLKTLSFQGIFAVPGSFDPNPDPNGTDSQLFGLEQYEPVGHSEKSAGDALQILLHAFGAVLFHAASHMGIDVQREGGGMMAEVFLHGLDVVACLQTVYGKGMAEIMEAHIFCKFRPNGVRIPK